jgi:Tat protein translocase TatB subunit
MFGTLGGPELFLILIVALIVFGPRKLPEMGKSLGRMMAEFRKASNEFQRTIEDEVEADKLKSAAPPPSPSLAEPAAPEHTVERDAGSPIEPK